MKLSKIFSIVTIAIMLVTTMSSVAFAANGIEIGGITINPNTDTNAATKVNTLGANILGVIQTVGTVVAIVVLIVLGIKYMMGSAEEKAEYKKTLVPYVIGAVIVLAASNVVVWIFEAGSSLFGL